MVVYKNFKLCSSIFCTEIGYYNSSFQTITVFILVLIFFSHQFWKEFLRDLEKNEMNDGGFDGFNANTFGETSNGDTTIPQYTHSKKRSCRIVSQLRI